MKPPLISVITITHNSDNYVKQTIKSIISQIHPNIEYIIIDGASEDLTLNIVKKYKNDIDYLISEPDDGIADAMNKGLKVAKGDYILFLHSDDYLVDEQALKKASHFFDSDHDIFLFNIFHSYANGRQILIRPRGLNWWINFKTGVLHQGTICSKQLFKKIGNFDTQFKIAMDYDFFLRAYRAGAEAKTIDFPLSVMRTGGISFQRDSPSLQRRFIEERQIHIKNGTGILLKVLYSFYWPAYLAYRKIHHFYK